MSLLASETCNIRLYPQAFPQALWCDCNGRMPRADKGPISILAGERLAKDNRSSSKSLCLKRGIIAPGEMVCDIRRDTVRDRHRDIFSGPCRRGRSTLRLRAKARVPRPVP